MALKRDPWGVAVDQAMQAQPGFGVPPTMDATTMPVPVDAAAGAIRPDVGAPKDATTQAAGGFDREAEIARLLQKHGGNSWVAGDENKANWERYLRDPRSGLNGHNTDYWDTRMRDAPGTGSNAGHAHASSMAPMLGNMSLALGNPAPTTTVDAGMAPMTGVDALMPGTAGALLPPAGDTAPPDATTQPVPVPGGTPTAPTAGAADPYAAMGGGTKLPSGAWVPKPGKTPTVTPGMDRAALLRLLQLGRGGVRRA